MLQFPEMTKEELENLNQMVQPIEKFFNEGCMCDGTNLRIVMCEREEGGGSEEEGGVLREERRRDREMWLQGIENIENLIRN